MALVQFEFDGKEFLADGDAFRSYKKLKALSNAKNDPAKIFDAFEVMFAGNDEAYAEMLGDSIDMMSQLLSAAIEAVGSKNS